MLKAGSLLVALAISLLISIVSLSLILYSYYNRHELDVALQKEQVMLNARSGLNLLMDDDLIKLGETKVLDLFNKGHDSVHLSKESWGIFELYTSKAFKGNIHFQKIALIGNKASREDSTALYLTDNDKPLTVAGVTQLTGQCYLPKAGIKKGFIEGQSYTGQSLVNGVINSSNQKVPELSTAFKEVLTQAFSDDFENDSVIIFESGPLPDSLINSFLSKRIILYSNGAVNLSQGLLSGNIKVYSKKEIKVSANCNIKDVVLVAPEITIEKDFTGKLQAFATDSIIVKEKVKLDYPSALCLVPTLMSKQPGMTLYEEVMIYGTVISYQGINQPVKTHTAISKNVKVQGQVYTNGILDLKGTVWGNVTCNEFILTTPSSVYSNHLLNAVIDRTKLSKSYTGFIATSMNRTKGIISWLY